MSEPGVRLQQAADAQISELIDLLSTHDQSALKLQCPGREKLGDGTVAVSAMHTADDYHRIADFLRTSDHGASAPAAKRSHRLPGFARARGHAAGHSSGSRPPAYSAQDIDLRRLLERLSTARTSLRPLADLSDGQLDTIPPAGEMKFCDGADLAADPRRPAEPSTPSTRRTDTCHAVRPAAAALPNARARAAAHAREAEADPLENSGSPKL